MMQSVCDFRLPPWSR